MRIVTDMIEFCTKEVPRWNTVSISGYHIREAGATAVQELAFTIADGIGYVQSCLDRGLAVDDFAPRLSFFFDVHNDFFEEIAKFRAARRLWARLMKERFGAKKADSCKLRTHAQTAGVSLTAQQPYNNVVRVALQALAAVLGGTQSLHTNSLDETYALPTEDSVTIALRTQQIIANESGVADFVDALGGSYAVEALTHRIELEANKYLARIDELGGMVSAIEQGYPQREIQNTAYQYQLEVERKQRLIVGLNAYTQDSAAVPVMKIDPKIEAEQVERLRVHRAGRDQPALASCLVAIERASKASDNLVPLVLAAVKAGATVGEISNVLRATWGEHQETLVL